MLDADATIRWSRWQPLEGCWRGRSIPGLSGLHRIRDPEQAGPLYVGQGKIRDRLRAHLSKGRDPEVPQGRIFGAAQQVECSWVLYETWLLHQRLELENDLIGSHMLMTAQVPAAQFLG